MKYSMFVGRWQPLHDGHKWLINERLKLGKNVLICIRDMETDEKNPFTAQEVKQTLVNHYINEIANERIQVMIIPDIESVNYGRGVGYEIIEHVPPQKIHDISATKIREKMRKDGKL